VLRDFEQIALRAGGAILQVFHDNQNTSYKRDSSPVTEADQRAEEIIVTSLNKAFPQIVVVAEESAAIGSTPDLSRGEFLLVDPLDGTKEFIRKSDEFTVNIAMVRAGLPIAGIVYAPAKGIAYVGRSGKAEKLIVDDGFSVVDRATITCRPPAKSLIAVTSWSHSNSETESFLEERQVAQSIRIGSSLKFCLVAEGVADIYPRFGRTMEWDTAAGDAVLRAAGGLTLGLSGEDLRYGKINQPDDCDFANPFFIAQGLREI
jgi:3'(2'), 5'-bisphosphate nucleotidase